MGLSSYTNEFDVEFMPDGELAILNYDWAQDDMMTFMTGQESNARKLLKDHETDPLSMFTVVACKDMSRIEILMAGRAFYEEIVRLSGVKEIQGCDVSGYGKAIYDAALSSSGFKITEVREAMAICNNSTMNEYNRQRYTEGNYYDFVFDLSPRYTVVNSAHHLGLLAHRADDGNRDFWEQGGRTIAQDQLLYVGAAVGNLADTQRINYWIPKDVPWHPGELPIPRRHLPRAQKLLVGAAVRAVDKLQQELGYAGERPELE